MLSYEDIFARHHARPLSFLTGHLDSPPISRRLPVVFRSPVLYRRPRPLSSPDLDISPRIFTHTESRTLTKPPPPKPKTKPAIAVFGDNYSSPDLDISPRIFSHTESRTLTKPPPPKPKTKPAITVFGDNYRLASTFPDRHLTRRELPLCTPDDLLDIIREPTGYYALPTDPWNEVYPDIYLSDAPTALCTAVLKRIGITHVLNAAQGKEKGCGQVNTWSGFYEQSGIKFLGVPAFDNIVFRIYPYFEEAAEFIDEGLRSKGKVLVHCRAGISRSATLVCAFLMMKRGLTAQEAVRAVRKNRAIIPNDGFLQQLCDLNDKLKRKPKI